MNGAHLHLIVNHLPIILPVVGVVVMVLGIISKSEAVKRTALLIFILGALASIAAMTTGETAEDVVENLSGVTENYIKTHEEAAETFALLTYILGGISIIALWVSFKRKDFSNITATAALLFAIIVVFFAQQTATTGGVIRHTEIRSRTSSEQQRTTNDHDE